jgi:hypothetical protein
VVEPQQGGFDVKVTLKQKLAAWSWQRCVTSLFKKNKLPYEGHVMGVPKSASKTADGSVREVTIKVDATLLKAMMDIKEASNCDAPFSIIDCWVDVKFNVGAAKRYCDRSEGKAAKPVDNADAKDMDTAGETADEEVFEKNTKKMDFVLEKGDPEDLM